MAKLLSESSAKWIAEQRKKVVAVATRTVRSPFVSATSFLGWRQWHCAIVDGALRVLSGSLAWGGGHYAVWPSGRTVSRANFKTISGTIPENATRYIVWYTKCYPCPVVHCPKAPNGNTECPAPGGNPLTWLADAGDIVLLETPERGEGWTDYHVIATISRQSTDSYTINQIQTAEIAVNAIVYPGEQGEESEDEESEDTQNCTDADGEDFPSDVEDKTEGPQNPEDDTAGGGGGDEEKFPSKIDVCW